MRLVCCGRISADDFWYGRFHPEISRRRARHCRAGNKSQRQGRLGGSYVRVGDADERMTEFEIYSYDAYHHHVKSDRRIIEEADVSLWNHERMVEYVRSVKLDRQIFA